MKLEKNDKTRETFYSEILDLISTYENAFANCLEEEYQKTGKKMTRDEAYRFFEVFENDMSKKLEPLVKNARVKMSSRDKALRNIHHTPLEEYIRHLDMTEYERFLGEKSKELSERLKENQDILKRLKEDN